MGTGYIVSGDGVGRRRGGAKVNEADGPGGACLLTGCLRSAGFFIGCGIDALDAVGTFFHNASGAYGYLRVVGQVRLGVGLFGVVAEVEDAGIVGACGGAVAGTPAAGVDHGVEPFAAVQGGVDGANGFAGGFLAVAACGGYIVQLACGGQIAADAQPLQVSAVAHFCGTYGRYVVFCTAGKGAGPASNAAGDVYEQGPLGCGGLGGGCVWGGGVCRGGFGVVVGQGGGGSLLYVLRACAKVLRLQG